jgi:hypothetical protein
VELGVDRELGFWYSEGAAWGGRQGGSMKAKVQIEFVDYGEAARYLAGYTSPLADHPHLATAHRGEFPLSSYDTRLSAHIAEAAALMLYERFCTDAGRKAGTQAVCGVKAGEKAETVHQVWIIPEGSWQPIGGDHD